ncbi:hypothetical protein M2284_001481 [Rhodococcus sp. LBL1]|nr:hypothetical protein [Rhodococcus sp. LBL1]MDH6682424.1 hypothetical protein [Rhodococcus sp. LBL2]
MGDVDHVRSRVVPACMGGHREHALARADERQHLLHRAEVGTTLDHRAARRRPWYRSLIHLVGEAAGAQHLCPSEVVQGHRFATRERVSSGDGEDGRLTQQYRALVQVADVRDVGCGDEDVDLVGRQQSDAVAVVALPDLHAARGVAGVEDVRDIEDELADRGADETHAQHAVESPPCRDRPGDSLSDLLIGRPQILLESSADRSQYHPSAGPLEQRGSDAALERFDGLTDPRRGHVQALGSAAEMQFLGQRQEYLDVAPLHAEPPFVFPQVNDPCVNGRCSRAGLG